MTKQTTVTQEQVNDLIELFHAGKPAFLIATDNCPNRITAGREYHVKGVDARRVCLTEDDGDTIRVGRDSDWMKYFYYAMTPEQLAEIEKAKALREAQHAAMNVKTSDQLITLITEAKAEFDLAREILRARVSAVL